MSITRTRLAACLMPGEHMFAICSLPDARALFPLVHSPGSAFFVLLLGHNVKDDLLTTELGQLQGT